MTRSFGTTKQSPSPQHHSPAALRWPPREIQLSWAKVSGMTRARPARTSANRARLPNIWVMFLSLAGPAADQITHTLLGSRIAPVADINSARGFVDNSTVGAGLRPRRRINPLIWKYKPK